MMEFYIAKTIKDLTPEKAEAIVTEKLKEHGFGIITEINVQETFKNKLDVDFKPYKILGACNPSYAYKAISASDKIGVMLPCNVCIQQVNETDVEVFAINPLVAMKPMNIEGMDQFAQEVYEHLNSVIQEL